MTIADADVIAKALRLAVRRSERHWVWALDLEIRGEAAAFLGGLDGQLVPVTFTRGELAGYCADPGFTITDGPFRGEVIVVSREPNYMHLVGAGVLDGILPPADL